MAPVTPPPDQWIVDFPTLGPLVEAWIEQHCVIPDRFHKGQPYVMADWQAWCTHNHYRVRPDAVWRPENPILGPAFHYRRSQIIAPQKAGKGPYAAATIANEAVGPALFAGWAVAGDAYDCADHGCPCGWGWDYEPGEPKGMPWSTPLIQLTAFSDDQTENTYGPLQSMIRNGPLGELLKVREGFIRLPNDGRIETVTSSAKSRLGNPIIFCLHDEALALDTPLPTPTGWTTMGEVSVGEQLIGADGLPTRVIKTTDTMTDRACWRVTFTDGSELIASDGHLWQTRVSGSAALPRVRTTGEMARDGRRFAVPRNSPLKLADVPLPIAPYVLGLWLGDGDSRAATVTASENDVDEVARQVELRGYTTKRCRTNGRAALLYLSIPGSHRNRFYPVKGLKVRLREQNLLENKHIPTPYLRAGTEQRIELLRGLMDSDGSVDTRGTCTFSQSDPGLVDDVVELLRSLGQSAHVTWRADARSRRGGGYKVTFTPVHDLVPFALPRKITRVVPAQQNREWVRVASIEPLPPVPVRCVGVDAGDHLFVAGSGWKVTHNTQLYTESNGLVTTARTQRRGVAGMGGRSMETTNCPNPAENSTAQQTYESASQDIFRFYRRPPTHLSWKNKEDRRRILRFAYEGSWWVDLDSIEAEAAELNETDPAESERFFGNRIVPGKGAWLPEGLWEAAELRDQAVA